MKPVKRVVMPEDVISVIKKDQNFLNRTGIKIYTTATNEEALELHKTKKADLIVAYLDMPGMKGEALCSSIRNNNELRNVSIILISADKATDHERCIQCGANSFISLPILSAVLLQEAYKLLHIAPRRSGRIPIKAKIEGTSKGKPFAGIVENISASGILFGSSAILNDGDIIKCSFSLPGSAKINVSAEIVRATEKQGEPEAYLYGVRFEDPENDVISAIEAFVG